MKGRWDKCSLPHCLFLDQDSSVVVSELCEQGNYNSCQNMTMTMSMTLLNLIRFITNLVRSVVKQKSNANQVCVCVFSVTESD